jgi:hypothetical protein
MISTDRRNVSLTKKRDRLVGKIPAVDEVSRAQKSRTAERFCVADRIDQRVNIAMDIAHETDADRHGALRDPST